MKLESKLTRVEPVEAVIRAYASTEAVVGPQTDMIRRAIEALLEADPCTHAAVWVWKPAEDAYREKGDCGLLETQVKRLRLPRTRVMVATDVDPFSGLSDLAIAESIRADFRRCLFVSQRMHAQVTPANIHAFRSAMDAGCRIASLATPDVASVLADGLPNNRFTMLHGPSYLEAGGSDPDCAMRRKGEPGFDGREELRAAWNLRMHGLGVVLPEDAAAPTRGIDDPALVARDAKKDDTRPLRENVAMARFGGTREGFRKHRVIVRAER